MTARARLIAHGLTLVAVALLLRGWAVGEVQVPIGDEGLHVPAARVYTRGRLTAETWWNPPAAYATIAASIALLGDEARAWRAPNVLLGSLIPLLVAMIGLALFPSGRAGWIAGWLVAVDPIHVFVSRGTFEEVGASFFFLAATLILVRAADGARWLEAAGLSMGASLAFKHYFAAASVVLVAFALAREGLAAPPARRARPLVALGLVPVAVYVAFYLPWLARGHGLSELLALHVDLLGVQQGRTELSYTNPFLAAAGTAPTWFASLSLFGSRLDGAQGWSRYHVLARNLPAWLLVLPSVALVCASAFRERGRGDLLLGALFLTVYVPLLLVGRPIFVYSAAALLPFAFLVVGRAFDLVRPRVGVAAWGPFLAAVILGLYCYPLTAFFRVPDVLYRAFVEAFVTVGG